MKATLKDVAKEAGVSKALVSKYLARTPDARMRDETRRRIDEAVRKCHYLPSKLAKSLKSGKTQTIGLVISDLRNAFWSAFADSALREARKHGYRLLISLCDFNREDEMDNLRTLVEYRVDGIIYCELLDGGELADQLHREAFPMVLMYQESRLFHTAKIDYRNALAQAVEYLAGRGHRRMFCVYSEFSVWPRILKRECRTRNVSFDSRLTPLDPAELLTALREICREAPAALFLNGWRTAVLLLQVIEQEFPGYRPEIILNFHFDHPTFSNPRIAGFVRSDFERLVQDSVRMLIRTINGEKGANLCPKAEFVRASEYRKANAESGPHYFLY